MPIDSTKLDRSKRRRILVVDDDRDMGETLIMLLKLMGHEATYIPNPLQALDTALSFRPHIAFLDLTMPQLDGYELARRFRGHAELATLPLIAVSGHGSPEDHARSRKAGFDAHVRKPLRAAKDAEGHEEDAARRLVQAFQTLLPATATLVAHHFTRVLLQSALEHIEHVGSPTELSAVRAESGR